MRLSSKLAERQQAKNTPGIVLPKVKEMMLHEHNGMSDRRWDILHPSELSHQETFCPRAVFLRITEGPVSPGEFKFETQNIFDEGHAIHAKWQDRLRKATPLWGDWECVICDSWALNSTEPDEWGIVNKEYVSMPCLYDGGHIWKYIEIGLDAELEALLVGRADGGFDDTLVELKSVGEGTVRIEDPERWREADGDLKDLWKGITRPFKTHLNQGDIYLWIAQQRGLPFKRMSFIYESKWNQLVKEFIIEYDEARSMKLINQAMDLKRMIEDEEEPTCRFPESCKNCEPFDIRRDAGEEIWRQ